MSTDGGKLGFALVNFVGRTVQVRSFSCDPFKPITLVVSGVSELDVSVLCGRAG